MTSNLSVHDSLETDAPLLELLDLDTGGRALDKYLAYIYWL